MPTSSREALKVNYQLFKNEFTKNKNFKNIVAAHPGITAIILDMKKIPIKRIIWEKMCLLGGL